MTYILLLITLIAWGAIPFFEKSLIKFMPAQYVGAFFGIFYGLFSVLLISVGLTKGEITTKLPTKAWILGGCCACLLFLGNYLFPIVLEKGNTSTISGMSGAWPIFTLIIAMLFLHERPNTMEYIGIGLVVAGVVILGTYGQIKI